MRITVCLVSVLLLNCGSVGLKTPPDGGGVIRGETDRDAGQDILVMPDTVDSGVSSTDASVETAASDSANAIVDAAPDSIADTTNAILDAQSNLNCEHCKFNCVNATFDAFDPKVISSCDGCVSNCPVNGLKLLCYCHQGCGYDPTEGVCNQQ